MAVVVVWNPSDPQVANKVSDFFPSANTPAYQGNPNTLINPDIGTLWTQSGGFTVPLKYWKYNGAGDIVEMSQAEKDIIDTLEPEVQVFNAGVMAASGPTAPTDAAIQVERGPSANASFKWDEDLQTWCIGLFGQEVQIADVDTVPTNITDLGDVRDPMSPSDGQVLTWNAGNSEWENQSPNHAINVADDGANLGTFNSINFIGNAVSAADGGGGEADVTINAPESIDDLDDVDTSTSSPSVGDRLEWDGSNWVPATPSTPSMRPTFAIWAEENSAVTVGTNNYEYSFGNGAVNSGFADVPGIPMGVNCTLIGIGVSARNNNSGNASSVSISVTRNGTVVATGGIASGSGTNVKIQNHTDITPDTVNFAPGDTLQFLTASETGTLDDVRVVAWFERTS